MDRMFDSPQNSYVETLIPKCDGIWRCALWEVLRVTFPHERGALMMKLMPLYMSKGK